MSVCMIKDLAIGEGKPKICIPIVGKDDQSILQQAQLLENEDYDLVELRIDFYKNILDVSCVLSILSKLRQIIKQPILLTYRSLKEGGHIQLTDEDYLQLIECVCASHDIDLIDVELCSGNMLVMQLVDIAHQQGKKVVMSHHNFDKTLDMNDLIDCFERMETLGADILKIAMMPQTYRDVIRMMNFTIEMSEKMNKPIVTMSMGQLGTITRLCGELTGSSITFASLQTASAPGQIPLKDMQLLLETIHHD